MGSAVTHLKVGDRAITINNGCYSTQKVLHSELVVSIPGDLSFEDAATLPTVFATVIFSIINIGRLTKGEVREDHYSFFNHLLILKISQS